MPATFRTAGIHNGRERALYRLGLHEAFIDLVELTLIVELAFGSPHQLDDVQPLFGHVVAHIVGLQRNAEHLDFRPVPTAHDVKRETSATNVIHAASFLGSET